MFEIKNGKPAIEGKALFIPEFKKLYNRDKSDDKARATKELAYVYFMADYESEFNIYGIEKPKMVALEVMDKDSYTPDKLVQDAIKKYTELQETASMRYLKSVRATTNSLIVYYEKLQFKEEEDEKAYNPKQLTAALKDVEIIIEKLEKWEKKVKGEAEDMNIRGGGKVGIFEDKESATWLQTRN